MKNLILVTLLLSVGYSQCNESNWQNYYPDMEGCYLYGADLPGADLSEADLSGANLTDAYLSGANLSGANLYGANLYEALLSGANLSGAVLQWAYLSGAVLVGVDFSEADLYGADLPGADLSEADLSGANLTDAYLSGANLSGANLYGANLYEALLSGANLSGACLEGAIGFTQTNYYGTPILEGCASGDGDCSFEDTDEDGYDDASYNAGLGDCSYEDLDDDGHDDSSYAGGMLAFDTNSDGIADNRPILRILGNDYIMYVADCNANYIDDGATCEDMTDGNISQNVEVSGDVVNMCIADDVDSVTYNIHYSCTNSQGFTDTDTRRITVYHSYQDGLIDGAQSGDINGDGVLNVIDLVMFVDIIIGR